MDVGALNSRISVVNANVKRLNNERQVSLGRLDTLKSQLDSAFAAYKEKFGVELTPETLNAELARVTAEKEKEVSYIEQIFQLIEAGDFAGANAMAEQGVGAVNAQSPASEVVQAESTVAEPANEEAEVVAEPPVAPSAPAVSAPAVSAPPVMTPPPVMEIPQAAVGAAQPTVAIPQPAVATPEKPKSPILSGLDLPTPPTVSAPPNLSGLGVTPATPAKPEQKVSSPNSFGAILSGTEFKG